MESVSEFIYTSAKPLPIILLLDTSRSMEKNGNIHTLNSAVQEMLHSFKALSESEVNVQVAIITFGDCTGVYLPLQSVKDIDINSIGMKARGGTYMARAIELAKEMIEDRSVISSRSYRPYVIMVTDGVPGDNWRVAMDHFICEGRSAKCTRMAMGIGDGSKGIAKEVLNRFVSSGENIFSADNANDILSFFRYVTMTTQQKTHGIPPSPPSEPIGAEDPLEGLLPY